VDFATLKLGADTSALKQAEKALDDVAAAATGTAGKVDGALDKMDASFDGVGASAKQAAGSVSAFEQAVHNAGSRIPVANDNIAGMGGSSKLASHHVQNLAFQFQDLGVQLASGANPMTAFIQQGTQIAGIMGQAGIGVRGLITAVAGMVAPFAPAVAIVGGLAAAIGLMTSDINENSKVTVTWTDTLLGAFDALKAGLSYGIDEAFKAFGTTTTEVWSGVVNAARTAINFVIGAVVAIPKAVYDAWTPLVAFADNLFVNVGNAILSRLNALMSAFGQDTFPLMKRSFEEGGVGVGDALANSIKDSMSRNWLGDAAAALSPYAQERARKRLEDDAKEAGKKAGEKAGEGTIESLTDYIDKNIGKSITAMERGFKVDISILSTGITGLEKIVAEYDAQKTRIREENDKQAMADLETFRNAILGVSDLFGRGIGDSIAKIGGLFERQFPKFAGNLGATFKNIGKSIDGVLGKLGTSLGQLGEQAGFGSAVGGMIGNKPGNQIGGAIGSVAGQAIGKSIAALGSFGGPIGMIAGSILGSVLGGLFKGKNPFADVRLSGTGAGTIFNQRGGEESASAGQALGSAFSNEMGIIAKALGATVNEATNFGAIGFSGDQFYFNPTGGDFKGAGAQRFSTAEQALTAAIRNAVDKGAFEGLSESSKAILASVTEINADAVVKAVERLNTARGKLVEAYNREAGAIAQTIDRFRGLTAGLEDFRQQLAEQLMSPEELFRSAQRQFAEVSALAAAGNEKAIGDLVSVSQRYIDAARGFLTPEEYNREIENVMAAVDLAIAQSKSMTEYAQSQLDALNQSVEGLLKVDESVLTVKDAIDGLKAVMESFVATATDPYVNPLYTQGDYYMGGGGGGGSFSDGQEPPRFAVGGSHAGGFAMVGEQGPELVNMGPARIWNAGETANMLSGGAANAAANAELVKQNEYLRELVRLNAKQERTLREIELQGETV
jgi:hypothetical protein